MRRAMNETEWAEHCEHHMELECLKMWGPRRILPYGKWTCADGTEVLFNRAYQPMFSRKDGVVASVNPSDWIDYDKQEWYYSDSNPPYDTGLAARHRSEPLARTQHRLIAILREWGVWEMDAGKYRMKRTGTAGRYVREADLVEEVPPPLPPHRSKHLEDLLDKWSREE